MTNTHLRINSNIFLDNNDSVDEMRIFYELIRDKCDSVKFSPLLRADNFSVINQVINFIKKRILEPAKYEELYKTFELCFKDIPIVRNPKTLGFVEYSMICLDTPIILNYNHRNRMTEMASQGYVNGIKLLTNGNISLSWNRDDLSQVIKFGETNDN